MSADRQVSHVLEGLAELEFVDRLLDTLDGLWETADYVPDLDRTLFMLAVSEITTNIAKHSEGPVAVRVQLDVSPEQLQATIRDTALPAGIDWESVELADPEAESGRGLALARSALDELDHDADPRGNTWTLARKLSDPPT